MHHRDPTPASIRDAASSDLDAIFAIYNHEVENEISTFEMRPKRRPEDDEWLTSRPPSHPVIVAELDGEVVGWGSLSRWSERGAYARTAEVSVYVARDRQGHGIGSALLTELISRAPDGGIAVLLARIAGANPPSLALHAKHGFEPIGLQRRAGEKLGRIVDVVLMDLHLDDPGRDRDRG